MTFEISDNFPFGYNRLMEKKIYIASLNETSVEFQALVNGLKLGGIEAISSPKKANDLDLYAIDLTKGSLAELEEKYPWIKNEVSRSGIAHLRVLPLIVYDSKKETPDSLWEKGAGEIYEEIFSEEFKPYAYDISSIRSSNEELLHVLSLYYVR